MSKQKVLVAAMGIGLLILVGGRFLIARSFLGGNTSQLQNTIIQPNIEENQLDEVQPVEDGGEDSSQKDTTPTIVEAEKTGILHIAIPDFVDQTSLLELTNTINNADQETQITLELHSFKSLEEYKKELKNNKQAYDVILVSSLWNESFEDTSRLPFQENITALFHPSIGEEISKQGMKRIPFGLDPFLTLTNEEIGITGELSRIDIEKYLLKNKTDAGVTLNFGIDDRDRIFLAQQGHPLPGYMKTLEYIISSNISSSTYNFLFQLFDSPFRSSKDLLGKAIESTSPICKIDVTQCLLQEKKLDVAFTTLHESDISGKHLYGFPDQEGLTSQVRGFMVPEKTKNKGLILTRLTGYLQEAPTSNSGLWNTTLPVFNTPLQQKLLQSEYAFIRSSIQNNKLFIAQGGIDNIQTWFTQTRLSEVLEGEYSSKIFIENQK